MVALQRTLWPLCGVVLGTIKKKTYVVVCSRQAPPHAAELKARVATGQRQSSLARLLTALSAVAGRGQALAAPRCHGRH